MAPYGTHSTHTSIELSDFMGSKRRGKFGHTQRKGKLPKRMYFQKKLVVINYMGESAPKQFTLKDNIVALRGLLPEIDVQASELEVRSSIASVIVNFGEEMGACTRHSFEFIEANGKSLCVPAKPRGFEWTGKAIKQLAGTGQVYVRLLYNPDLSSSASDTESDMPNVFLQQSHDDATKDGSTFPRFKGLGQYLSPSPRPPSPDPRASQSPSLGPCTSQSPSFGSEASQSLSFSPGASQLPSSSPGASQLPSSSPGAFQPPSSSPGTSQPPSSSPGASQPPSSSPGASQLPSPSPGVSAFPLMCSEPPPSSNAPEINPPHSGSHQLGQMFPNISKKCLHYVLKLSNGDLSTATDCILSGPSIELLVSRIRSFVLTGEGEGRRLCIDEEEKEGEDLVQCIFAFYKGPRFDPHSGLRILLEGQPAIDTGGVRRQVLSEMLKTVAFSDHVGLFEGPPNRRRPTFRISSLSAGMMRLLGRIIGHSIILDCQGFPYLSPACYSCMVGNHTKALSQCTLEDVSERVQRVLAEVSDPYDLVVPLPFIVATHLSRRMPSIHMC